MARVRRCRAPPSKPLAKRKSEEWEDCQVLLSLEVGDKDAEIRPCAARGFVADVGVENMHVRMNKRRVNSTPAR